MALHNDSASCCGAALAPESVGPVLFCQKKKSEGRRLSSDVTPSFFINGFLVAIFLFYF
jgi:hypothetical protein